LSDYAFALAASAWVNRRRSQSSRFGLAVVLHQRQAWLRRPADGLQRGKSLLQAAVNLKKGLVEDKRETHPQADAASQLDGVHEGLPFWTAEPRPYPIGKTPFSVGNRWNHLWTAW